MIPLLNPRSEILVHVSAVETVPLATLIALGVAVKFCLLCLPADGHSEVESGSKHYRQKA